MGDEAALKAGNDTFRLIVETIPGLIAVMTPTGAVEHVNGQVLEYFGRTLEELRAGAVRTPFTLTTSRR
jgi:PAS domain-containing protein